MLSLAKHGCSPIDKLGANGSNNDMKKFTLANSVLMVIDMQRYFLEKDAPGFLDPPKTLIPNVIRLITAFRKAEKPIVFTRHAHTDAQMNGQMSRWWGGELPKEGDQHSNIIDELGPKHYETVITKARYSAFEKTALARHLKGLGIDTVVICGVMTNLCVETTARHAFMKNFQPLVVEDACASKNKAYHEASLLNLGYGFAHIEKTEGIVKMIASEPPAMLRKAKRVVAK